MTINWFWIAVAVMQVGAGVWGAYQGNVLAAGLSACYAVADVIIAFIKQ